MRVAIVQSCYVPWKGYFDLIRTRRDISAYRDRLLFGRRHALGDAAAA